MTEKGYLEHMNTANENRLEERTAAEIFSEYAALLLRWSWLLILLALIAGGTAYEVSRRDTPIYQASTLIMINGAPGIQADAYGSIYLTQLLTTTYAQTLTTGPMLDAIAKKLGLQSLPASIQVQTIQNTSLMRITVKGADPDQAALIANTMFSVFADQVQADQASRYADSKKSLEGQMAALNQQIQDTTDALTTINQKIQDTQNSLNLLNQQIAAITQKSGLEAVSEEDRNQQAQLQSTLVQYQPQQTQLQTALSQYQNSNYYLMQSYEQVKLAEAQSTSLVLQKDPAVPQRSPIQPQPVRSALLAAVVGLMIAAGIIFLIEFLDDSIRDPMEITRLWGLPVLGMIVSFNSSNGNALITAKQPRSPVSEAFRSLRTNLQFASIDAPIKTLLITSPSPEDGKSTIVTNLANVIAQSGFRSVVVDADLRRPKIHRLLQLSNRMGLSDEFIRPQNSLNGSVQSTEFNNLYAMTSGSLPPNPSELMGSDKMLEILSVLKNEYDLVLLDTPPALVVTDANVLATRVDGVLLVIRPTVTKRAAVKHVIEQLRQVNANIVGVVFNDVNVRRSHYYYRGYYYSKYGKGYHYSESYGDSSPEHQKLESRNKKKVTPTPGYLDDSDKTEKWS
jgi:polysaccharide biosynthesis transport protein